MRGEAVEPRTMAEIRADLFVRRAEWQGLLPLAALRLADRPDATDELRAAATAAAAPYGRREVGRETALRAMAGAFSARAVRALLLKGAHLAHTHYERSDLRPRSDTDILVAEADREQVFEGLRSLGYQENAQAGGALVMSQVTYVRHEAGRLVDAVDVHWKIANPRIFSDLVSFEELFQRSAPVPALGDGVRVPGDVDALLIACVHRVAHHRDADRLIWLYDIHLIAERLTRDDWQAFVASCHARSVAHVCWWSLERTRDAFGTAVPGDVLSDLVETNRRAEHDTAAFLVPGRRHVEQVVSDLRALPSWKDRVRLVGQHLFPSPRYMRSRYAPASSAPLPVLYVRRAMSGAWKWLAKP